MLEGVKAISRRANERAERVSSLFFPFFPHTLNTFPFHAPLPPPPAFFLRFLLFPTPYSHPRLHCALSSDRREVARFVTAVSAFTACITFIAHMRGALLTFLTPGFKTQPVR